MTKRFNLKCQNYYDGKKSKITISSVWEWEFTLMFTIVNSLFGSSCMHMAAVHTTYDFFLRNYIYYFTFLLQKTLKEAE